MKDATRNFLVGLFTLVALAVLAMLMVWFGEAPTWLSRSDWRLDIRPVGEVTGVGAGNRVYFNGVEIGRVEAVDFIDVRRPGAGIRITALIRPQYTVPFHARARVYGAVLGVGQGRIDVVAVGEADPLPRDGSGWIRGEMASTFRDLVPPKVTDNLERMIEEFGNMAESVIPAAQNFAQLLEDRSPRAVDAPGARIEANVSTAVKRLDELIANLNRVLGDDKVQDDVKGVARDLKDITEDLKATVALWHDKTGETADNLNRAIRETESGLTDLLRRLNETAVSLNASARHLASATQAVADGTGSMGRFIHDPRLYEAGVLSLQRLAAVMEDLQVITGKIRQDGHITIAQKTGVGTFSKDFPIGSETRP